MTDHFLLKEKLDKLSVFKGVSEQAFKEISDSGYMKNLVKDEILFHQGDSARYVYFILSGRVKLARVDESGEEVIIRFMGADELLAAVAVLAGKKYPVTVEVIQSGRAIYWDGNTIRELMKKYPDIAINALDITLDRLCDVQSRFFELSVKRVEQRIARTLLRLMNKGGKKTDEGVEIDFPVSRQDIAEFAGTTLHTVSRTISAWEKKGWVKSSREKIIICDTHTLVSVSEDLL